MYEKDLIADIVRNLLSAVQHVVKRFEPIQAAGDFVKDDAGREKLDGICMQLIAIGEALKQVDKITGGEFLERYPGVDWKSAMGMRDIIAHHYFDIDHETVYVVCREHVPEMRKALDTMVADLAEG